MADTNSLRGDTVIETLVNMSSPEMRGETAVETIANIVGYDVPEDLIGAILAMVGAPDDLRGKTVVETIANIVHTFDATAEVPDNVIDALVMLNEASGGEPYSDGKNLFAVSAARDGYLDADGSFIESSGSNHPLTSDFIPVKPGQSLVLQAWAQVTSTSSSGGQGNLYLAYCFYDKSKSMVGSRTYKYGGTALASGQSYSTYTIVVPNGAAYIRATYRRVLGGYAKLEYGEEATAWTPAPQDVAVILDEASVLHADDAAMLPPLTTTVFGSSTQDGTPTIEAPVPIVSVGGNLAVTPYTQFSFTESRGVTYTQNSDGSINARGTATGGLAYLSLCNSTNNPFGLERGKTYTLVTTGKNVNLRGNSTQKITPVTIPDTGTWTVDVGVSTGVTVDETFTFAVFESATGCRTTAPYGCIGLLASGANLIDSRTPARTATTRDVTIAGPDESGWFDISGTSTATSSVAITLFGGTNSKFLPPGWYSILLETEGTPFMEGKVRLQVYGVKSDSGSTYVHEAGAYQLDYTENGIDRIGIHVHSSSSGTTVSGRFRLTLVSGTTAPTAYIPYTETVTPIDLDGHKLRSLPDGTRDFVTVGIDGKVTLVQQVGSVVPTSTNVKYSSSNTELGICIFRDPDQPAKIVDGISGNLRSSRFVPAAVGNAAMPDGSMKMRKPSNTTSYTFIYYRNAAFTTTDDQKAWLDENPTEFLFPLETPVTHDLGYVELPSMPSPVFNMSVAASGEPTLMTRYLRGRQSTTTSGEE